MEYTLNKLTKCFSSKQIDSVEGNQLKSELSSVQRLDIRVHCFHYLWIQKKYAHQYQRFSTLAYNILWQLM